MHNSHLRQCPNPNSNPPPSVLEAEDNCVFLQLNNKFAHQMPRVRMQDEEEEVEDCDYSIVHKKGKNWTQFLAQHCGLLSPRALRTRGPAKVLNKVAIGSRSLSASPFLFPFLFPFPICLCLYLCFSLSVSWANLNILIWCQKPKLNLKWACAARLNWIWVFVSA